MRISAIIIFSLLSFLKPLNAQNRQISLFTEGWRFNLGDTPQATEVDFDDSKWRLLNLPHDWSIEGEFSEKHPAKAGGGALPGGIGWYRKTFTLPATDKGKNIFIDFDGVYRNAEVWVNGAYLGKRPYGYASFRCDATPFLKYGTEKNVVVVKADNSQQQNSRWYSGSGIYRNVHLVKTNSVYVDFSGTYVFTPLVSEYSATVKHQINIRNSSISTFQINIQTSIVDKTGLVVATSTAKTGLPVGAEPMIEQVFEIKNPKLWSDVSPYMYKAVVKIMSNDKVLDTYETPFGIRTTRFDREKGFFLNGKPTKIKGVCMHHDLGCLGAAVNVRAMERQLEILKAMGCNGIRTSHNPPAPELLDLCDKMGFLVMDESFDVWKKNKTQFDYGLDWDQWHTRDLEDFIKRDRNHPSVVIWSVGNEIPEQGSQDGVDILSELIKTVKSYDDSRPVTMAVHEFSKDLAVLKYAKIDVLGFNYGLKKYDNMLDWYTTKPMILTETVSALNSRGVYDMPSDSIRRWPIRWDLPFKEGNADLTCSAYDNVSAPWGCTHEEMMHYFKNNAWMSGMFVWTGFDYLGEPTPYDFPARSSYFGIIDLAGIPKDVYYMYQSEWTKKDVLHLFPHWNWEKGQIVDVWAYSNADEVELFLNGKSLGKGKKAEKSFHFMWRIPFEAGELKAVSRKKGQIVSTKIIRTASQAAKVQLTPDRNTIKADGTDLSFITVKILDKNGNLVPKADNLVKFELVGDGEIVGVDNGLQTSMESFKAKQRKAFNGQCIVVVQSKKKAGKLILKARTEGVEGSEVLINVQ